jgi:hypothetical protein
MSRWFDSLSTKPKGPCRELRLDRILRRSGVGQELTATGWVGRAAIAPGGLKVAAVAQKSHGSA